MSIKINVVFLNKTNAENVMEFFFFLNFHITPRFPFQIVKIDVLYVLLVINISTTKTRTLLAIHAEVGHHLTCDGKYINSFETN